MRAWCFVVVLAAGSGCGSSDPSTPLQACNDLAGAVCNRLFACFPTQAAAQYGSEAACTPTLQQAVCANAACPAGTTFHGSAATKCLNEYKAESCADVGNDIQPASCAPQTLCS